MKKIAKKLISVVLVTALLLSMACFAGAEDDAKVSITIMSSNVAGLPIASKFSPNGRDVQADTEKLASMINESGYDIVCVQEDFQFHSLFAKQMTNYPYQTYTSGGIPIGDGLNIFSKYPIYNVERQAWTDFNGILGDANDGLTPKGFLKCTVDVDGVLVDIYDTHFDANSNEADQRAKTAQFSQIADYIDANSADRPVMITGDFNSTLHTDYFSGMYETMVLREGFKDSWVMVCNDGDYLRGDDAQERIDSWYAKYNNCYWGLWDSVERVFYRGGNGAVVTATQFGYETYCDPVTYHSLSDHSMMKATLEIDTTDYVRPDIQLAEPTDRPYIDKLVNAVKMFARCISLLLSDLFAKLIAGELF